MIQKTQLIVPLLAGISSKAERQGTWPSIWTEPEVPLGIILAPSIHESLCIPFRHPFISPWQHGRSSAAIGLLDDDCALPPL
uniref:Uncharacterized protein n=1 Tax=Pelusios castaneus TaxID=367368 RepID=A0A8C8S9R6_9SAUR